MFLKNNGSGGRGNKTSRKKRDLFYSVESLGTQLYCLSGQQFYEPDGGHVPEESTAVPETAITIGGCYEPVCQPDGCESARPCAWRWVAGRGPDEADPVSERGNDK